MLEMEDYDGAADEEDQGYQVENLDSDVEDDLPAQEMELEIDDGLEVTQQGTQQSAAQPDATQETDDIVHFGRVRNRYHFHISASTPQNLLQFSLIFPYFPPLRSEEHTSELQSLLRI